MSFIYLFCLFRLLKSRGKFKHLNVVVVVEHSETPREVRTTCSATDAVLKFNTYGRRLLAVGKRYDCCRRSVFVFSNSFDADYVTVAQCEDVPGSGLPHPALRCLRSQVLLSGA